jgi:DNA repair protein RAD5
LRYFSQWQSEIERYAGHLSVTTLHNEEITTAQAIATSDVVIVSTFLIQQSNANNGTKSRSKQLLQLLKRVHWHRIVVDEAHMNNQTQTKLVISALSATHRHAVTGTPIGAQLSDLYDQVRFLRLAPFCRPSFWKNLIEDPYYGEMTRRPAESLCRAL